MSERKISLVYIFDGQITDSERDSLVHNQRGNCYPVGKTDEAKLSR